MKKEETCEVIGTITDSTIKVKSYKELYEKCSQENEELKKQIVKMNENMNNLLKEFLIQKSKFDDLIEKNDALVFENADVIEDNKLYTELDKCVTEFVNKIIDMKK